MVADPGEGNTLSAKNIDACEWVGNVGWALIVAFGIWQITDSPWRWLGVAHAVVTIVVVSATANHYWMDGIVAALLVALAAGFQLVVRSH